MKKNILFSIIIPTYNRAEFILNTIRSVLNQSYTNFEVIVVDDGSKDNTEELVKTIEDKRVTYYLKENGERGAARNYGANLAKGNYLNFFDSDDLLYSNHLSVAAKLISENNSPEVFHLGYDFKSLNGEIVRNINLPEDLNKGLLSGNCLSCNGVFIRKDIAKKYPFEEDRNLAASEDYLLWLRLGTRYRIISDKTITSTIIEHENRSVLSTKSVQKLVLRKKLMLKYLFEDHIFIRENGRYKKMLISDAYSYISLHLALTGKHKKQVIKYLMKSIISHPFSIISKRTFAIIKYLIFN